MANYQHYQNCIDACLDCASICNYCAGACTREENVKMMALCIQLDMECSVICYAAAQLMSVESDKAQQLCEICADICDKCANECSKHETEHCKKCAEACRECAKQCRQMAAATA